MKRDLGKGMFPKWRSAPLLIFLFLAGSVALSAGAVEYKLYINKEQNNGNVVVFKDSMTASVTHTAEGLELVLPGVDVQLRCKSNTSTTGTDACVIAVQAATTTTTSTSTSSTGGSGTNTDTGTSSGTTSSGTCTTTTWNDCSGSGTGSDTTTTTTTTTTTPTTSSPSGGGTTSGGTNGTGSTSDACTSSGAVSCFPYDFGPGGNAAGTGVVEISVRPGKVSVMPITTYANAKNFGTIARYPTSAQEVTNGAVPRIWISQKPNGAPLSSSSCAQIGGMREVSVGISPVQEEWGAHLSLASIF